MTQPTATDTADTNPDSEPVHGAVIALLVAVVVIAGSASMLMSFHGLCDLVERVEDVHGWLSYVGPIGIDGLQLATLFAIVTTSTAPTKVRVYLWVVFLASIGLSVAGNCVDAAARHAGLAGIVLSGVWPALLAAATHVVVMAVRWWQSSRQTPTTAGKPNLDNVGQELGADEDAEPSEPKSPTPAQLRARARTLYQNGRSCKQVADVMTRSGASVSEKQVERWTKDLRTAPAVSDINITEPTTLSA